MSRVYLCVSIDTECDKGSGWRSKKPMSFEGIHEGVARRLQPMFVAVRGKPTYLLSPEVMGDARSAEALQKLGACELGTHLHGEYAEPGAFEPDVTTVFQRDYPPELERQKLVSLTDAFVRMTGAPPRSFRAGRFGIGISSLGLLESLGYVVESSVTPHMDWSASGAPGLHYHDAPTQPYHPDPQYPGRRGSSRLLEVPVTIRKRVWNAIPVLRRWVDPAWLRPTRGSVAGLLAVARDEIAEARRQEPARPVILNAMFHNVEVCPGLSPYASTEAEASAILGRLGALLDFARSESIAVVGLSDVPEILRA